MKGKNMFKNIIIIILGYFVFVLWRKNEAAERVQRPTTAPAKGTTVGNSIKQPVAAAKNVISQLPSPSILMYGDTNDPAGSQQLTIDLSTSDAANYLVDDSVKVINSKLYPLYYRVVSISDKATGIKAVMLNTRYVGSETETYLSPKDFDTSGFTVTTTKNQSSFL